ncbi:MAG: HNH endonuclease signature motif containing protein [Actinomycetota bacterium]
MGRRARFTREELAEAVTNARSYSEALRKLGYRVAGGNHATLKKYVELWKLSTDHFDPNWALKGGCQKRIPLSEILVEGSTYSRWHLKERLYSEGVKERRCELCGQGPTWRGREIALILDHINGIGDDNRLENLRIACPNCAATFDTHCGRHNRRPPLERDCALCGRTFFVRYSKHRYCSQRCGTRAGGARGALRGRPRPERRKVPRPSAAQLAKDLESMSYCAVGRKYGVSDNAIRKWLKWYERERQALEAA